MKFGVKCNQSGTDSAASSAPTIPTYLLYKSSGYFEPLNWWPVETEYFLTRKDPELTQ